MSQHATRWKLLVGGVVVGAIAITGARLPASAQDEAITNAVRIERIVMARGIARHRPTEEGTSFAAGSGRVYAWMQVENPSRTETAVIVKWQRPGGRVPGRGARLSVPATRRYSTFAFLQPQQVGTWTVVVETEAGVELARQTFEVTPRT